MARKLTDSEFVERTRAFNRRRGERHRERLAASGKSALTVWIPDTVRTALNAKAAIDGATLADTATALLSRVLDTTPLPVDRTERDQQILELHRQGVNNTEIGRRFNTSEGSIRRALKRVQKVTT